MTPLLWLSAAVIGADACVLWACLIAAARADARWLESYRAQMRPQIKES